MRILDSCGHSWISNRSRMKLWNSQETLAVTRTPSRKVCTPNTAETVRGRVTPARSGGRALAWAGDREVDNSADELAGTSLGWWAPLKGLTGYGQEEISSSWQSPKLIDIQYPLSGTTAGYQTRKTGTAASPVVTGWQKRGAVVARCR